MRLGTIIRKIRLDMGVSQVDLAQKSEISKEYLCRVEACKANPSLKVIQKIANSLGILPMSIIFLSLDGTNYDRYTNS